MRIFDEKFAANKLRYIMQTCLATATILIILFVLNTISDSAVIASMGASCFIVFLFPHTKSSNPRSLIGGYVVGMIIGSIFNFISTLTLFGTAFNQTTYSTIVFAALAVGISMFLMAVTCTEHPPAAGIALGLVFDEWRLITIIAILTGILVLSLVRLILKPYLINLN